MTFSRKFSSALLAVGCVTALAVGASPASAQLGPLSGGLAGALGVTAVKDGSKGRVGAKIVLPVGTSVSGRVLLGKRVLCKAATKKQVTDGALTGISCSFPLRNLAAKKSNARASLAGRFVTLRLSIAAARTAQGEPVFPAPIIILVPIAVASFEAS